MSGRSTKVSQMRNAKHTHMRRMQRKGWIRDFEIVLRVKERLSVRRKRERVTSHRSRGDEARCPIREKVSGDEGFRVLVKHRHSVNCDDNGSI